MRDLPSDAPDIVYLDEHFVATAKPSGELVHPGWARGEPTTLSRLRNALGSWVYPVHRLDRATSGVLVMARSPEAARALASAWQEVEKRYLALVRGTFPERCLLDHPVKKRRDSDERQRAVTQFERLAGCARDRCSLVQARPQTGRLHQIRRHLKHLSHPIVGDVTYGDGRLNRHFRSAWNLHRLALHATSLRFVHPLTREPLCLEATLPADLREPLEALGLR